MDRFDSVWCSSHWLWCGLWKKYLLKVESKPKGKLCKSFEVRQKSHSLQCEAKPRLVMLSWTLLITLQPFKYFILAIYYFHSTGFAGHHHWVLSTVPVLVTTIKYSTNWPNAFSCTQGFPFSNGSPQWGGALTLGLRPSGSDQCIKHCITNRDVLILFHIGQSTCSKTGRLGLFTHNLNNV